MVYLAHRVENPRKKNYFKGWTHKTTWVLRWSEQRKLQLKWLQWKQSIARLPGSNMFPKGASLLWYLRTTRKVFVKFPNMACLLYYNNLSCTSRIDQPRRDLLSTAGSRPTRGRASNGSTSRDKQDLGVKHRLVVTGGSQPQNSTTVLNVR